MIGLLFSRGANGIPPQGPVDFATLVLPPSPNTCLLTPVTAPGMGHLHRDPLPATADAVLAAIRATAAAQPRTWPLADFAARGQAQWVVRSRIMNYPDIIAAEAAPAGAGTGLWLYSRSLIGWSDFGVNRARVLAWLAEIEGRLRRP